MLKSVPTGARKPKIQLKIAFECECEYFARLTVASLRQMKFNSKWKLKLRKNERILYGTRQVYKTFLRLPSLVLHIYQRKRGLAEIEDDKEWEDYFQKMPKQSKYICNRIFLFSITRFLLNKINH